MSAAHGLVASVWGRLLRVFARVAASGRVWSGGGPGACVGRRLAALVLSVVAVGAFAAGASADPFVYVANSGDGSASQFNAGLGGILSPDSPATVASGNSPFGVAVSPDGSSVYVTNNADNTVSEFDVGAGGVLTPKSPAAVATGSGPVGVAVSPDGKSVYVAGQGDGNLSEFNVGAGGVLTPKSPAEVYSCCGPYGVAVSPDGSSVYVSNTGSDTVSEYSVGAGGVVSFPKTVATGDNPWGIAVSPDGKSVYVVNNNFSGTVSEYSVGAGGLLSPMSPATVATGAGPIAVAVSPDGSSVYVANQSDNTVSEFNVGAGGVLTPKTPATVATGIGPNGVAVSPDGSSVYVTNDLDNTVSEFNVGTGGVLSAKTPATVATGISPYGIVVRPPPTVTGVSPASGPAGGGTPITITGSGFVAGAMVEIGQGGGAGPHAIPATNVTVVSPTEITATTGGSAKPGNWNVFVTNSGGTSAPNPDDQFTYTRPTVSGVSPTSGPVSGGTPITITGTNFVTGASVVIGQGNGAGSKAIPATNVDVVSPTEITATTAGPAKRGSWNVFVVQSGAASPANNNDLYTYTATSPPRRAARTNQRARPHRLDR